MGKEGQEKPKTKAPNPAVGDTSRPSARQTRQGPETRPHRQGQVGRQRLRQIVGPQTKGKERAQIVSSSFFRFPSRVDFRETQQEEHLQVDSLKKNACLCNFPS